MGFNELMLKNACINGDIEKVRHYLNEVKDPNELWECLYYPDNGKAPFQIHVPSLFFACLGDGKIDFSKNTEYAIRQPVIELLLNDPRVAVNMPIAIGPRQYTILDLLRYREIQYQNEIAQLEKYYNIDCINNDFLLKQACLESNVSEVKRLLDEGADPNALFECKVSRVKETESNDTFLAPVWFFAYLGERATRNERKEAHQAVIETLVNHKNINVNKIITIASRKYSVLGLLYFREIEFFNDIDQLEKYFHVECINDDLLLKRACLENNITNVRILLEQGADPNALFEVAMQDNIFFAPALYFACLGKRYNSENSETETEQDRLVRRALIALLLNDPRVNVNGSVVKIYATEEEVTKESWTVLYFLNEDDPDAYDREIGQLLHHERVDVNASLSDSKPEEGQSNTPLFCSIRYLMNRSVERLLSCPRVKTITDTNSALFTLYFDSIFKSEIPAADNDPTDVYSTMPILSTLIKRFILDNRDIQFSSYSQLIETMFKSDKCFEDNFYEISTQQDGGVEIKILGDSENPNEMSSNVRVTVSLTKNYLDNNIGLLFAMNVVISTSSMLLQSSSSSSFAPNQPKRKADEETFDETANRKDDKISRLQ
jgi:hypothetical protein